MVGRRHHEAKADGNRSRTAGSFPSLRLVWYLALPTLLFLFFPFRALQWVSLAFIILTIGTFAASYLLFRGIEVKALVPVTYGYRFDEIAIEFEVWNGTPLPAINLAITLFTPSEIPGKQKAQRMFTLRRASRERFTARFPMSRRGEFSVSPFVIEGSDPFGFFPWQVSFRDLCRLVVYPSIHHGLIVPRRGVPGGSIRVHRKLYEDVNRVASIREYRSGDDLRRIHWNATAKSGTLEVREFVKAMDAPVMILFDLDASVYPLRYRHERIETAVEIAASLVHSLTESNRPVALVSNGLDGGDHPVLPTAGHRESAIAALRVLARIAASYEATDPLRMFLEAGLPAQPGMGCFIITPRQPGTLARELMHPSIASLDPVYLHLDDRPAPPAAGLRLTYRKIDEPRELFV
jgi:uncharacterized protein (DUF58 family)